MLSERARAVAHRFAAAAEAPGADGLSGPEREFQLAEIVYELALHAESQDRIIERTAETIERVVRALAPEEE